MSETLHVETRGQFGKRNNRRLRRAGRLPAILYGHGKKPESLTVAAEEMDATIRHGAHIVELEGAAKGQALLQDVQWDTFSQHVLHVDLLRIEKGQKVKIEVAVELRGEAPGSREGGIVDVLVHSVEIEVPADKVPDKLHLNINRLELDGSLTAADIEDMPEGARLLSDPDEMIVHCVTPQAEPEEEEGIAAEGAEPEVIGKKEDEEEGEEAES